MKILYYDCFAGISGDMNLGALLDLGVSCDHLRAELAKLLLDGWRLDVERAQKRGITGTRVRVSLTGRQTFHRTLPDIEAIIDGSGVSTAVKMLSLKAFHKLAEAEAQVHNVPVTAIHFHEVGAVDAIVDIVGAAICREALPVDRVLCGTVELGGGFARCAHGLLPVPAPATALLLAGAPVKLGAVPFEATTPTGAALLATVVDEYTNAAGFTIACTGYGIGQHDAEVPNVLRVFLGEMPEAEPVETLWLLECNLDDMNPELYGHVMERLLTEGANDVYLTPILMKKGRPAILLSVLCAPVRIEALTAILFTETTTLGVRRHPVSRVALVREFATVTTRYGDVAIKTAHYHGRPVNRKPEYADCSRLATQQRIPIKIVYDEVYRVLSTLPAGNGTDDRS